MVLLDTIEVFEVNRKECARLLLEYPKWTVPGTFKPKPGVPVTTEPIPTKDWQLESTVIEVCDISILLVFTYLTYHSTDCFGSILCVARIDDKTNVLHWFDCGAM
jgi:nuclear cap-binding protein subunit 1